MTAITSAAGAETTIDWVDWSAMGGRLTVRRGAHGAAPRPLSYSRVGRAGPDQLDSSVAPYRMPWATMPTTIGAERTRRARVQRPRDNRGGPGRGHHRPAGDQRGRTRVRGRDARAPRRPVARRDLAGVRRAGGRRGQGPDRRRRGPR